MMLAAPVFFFWWVLGVVLGLALLWAAVRVMSRLARLLEHLDDARVWPFGPR